MTKTPHKVEVGGRLQTALEGLGFETQAAAAEKFGLDRTKLNHWIKGTNYPDPAFLVALYKMYHVTFDWIYLGDIAGLRKSLADYLDKAESAFSEATPVGVLPQRGKKKASARAPKRT